MALQSGEALGCDAPGRVVREMRGEGLGLAADLGGLGGEGAADVGVAFDHCSSHCDELTTAQEEHVHICSRNPFLHWWLGSPMWEECDKHVGDRCYASCHIPTHPCSNIAGRLESRLKSRLLPTSMLDVDRRRSS